MYLGWQCPHFLGREGLAARLRPSSFCWVGFFVGLTLGLIDFGLDWLCASLALGQVGFELVCFGLGWLWSLCLGKLPGWPWAGLALVWILISFGLGWLFA